MNKSIAIVASAIIVSMAAVPAHAGSLGGKRVTNTNVSSGGLINVSPSIQGVNVLSGTGNGVLNGSSVLSGNNTGIGVLGTGTGLLKSVTTVITNKNTSKRR